MSAAGWSTYFNLMTFVDVASAVSGRAGKVQPAMDDPIIANKKTYWESNGQITHHVKIT